MSEGDIIFWTMCLSPPLLYFSECYDNVDAEKSLKTMRQVHNSCSDLSSCREKKKNSSFALRFFWSWMVSSIRHWLYQWRFLTFLPHLLLKLVVSINTAAQKGVPANVLFEFCGGKFLQAFWDQFCKWEELLAPDSEKDLICLRVGEAFNLSQGQVL